MLLWDLEIRASGDEGGDWSRIWAASDVAAWLELASRGRVVRQPNRYLGSSEAQIVIPDDGIEDPLTYKQALNDVDYKKWLATQFQMKDLENA
ncbi:gag/pol protein [Cucumis melo var. makuwa]|uniref:Gag/pol protein n=1 Tax=Cucumis melo var. makuwa TaxID=1194695 RepID=A0A5A7UX27_CUCMM|nr:gag/pol protein [Cucumis melo var. makuwa]TYK00763.1 gag/pol protein [Cucumis melo var. makuwa]